VLTQDEAVQIIEDGQKRVADLIAQLPDAALTEKGIGSDNWTVQDLIGHLAYWENAASEALDAWAMGGVAPIDRALRRGINVVNADALRAIRGATLEHVRQRADQAHSALLVSILEMGPDLWGSLPTARHLDPIADVLGRILAGPGGPYRHAEAHIPDLEAFVARMTGAG
jgi:hypothetical protein